MASRRGLLVERVEYRYARALLHAAYAGYVLHLVDHDGIGYVGVDACYAGYFERYQSAEVGCVLQLGVPQVLAHALVDEIYAAFDRAQQAAAADYRIERGYVYAVGFESVDDHAQTPLQLVGYRVEACDLLGRVTQRQRFGLFEIVEKRDFGRCRSRVYGQYVVTHSLQLLGLSYLGRVRFILRPDMPALSNTSWSGAYRRAR